MTRMNPVFVGKGAIIGEANEELKLRPIINSLVIIRVSIIGFRRDSSGLV